MSNHVTMWRDVFVVVDNGKVPASEYVNFGQRIIDQAAQFEHGIAGLAIIPPQATPPPEEVRKAINEALLGLSRSLRCFCWLVEGSGFQAAMVRGVLNGIRMFSRQAYPTFITANLDEALSWMLPHLGGGKARSADLVAARKAILSQTQGRVGNSFT